MHAPCCSNQHATLTPSPTVSHFLTDRVPPFLAGSRELATFQTVSHPRDPHLYRAPAISLPESLRSSPHKIGVVNERDHSPLRHQNSPSLRSMTSPGTYVSAPSPSRTAYVTSTAYRTPQSWTASLPSRTMSPHRRSVSPQRRSGPVREDYA